MVECSHAWRLLTLASWMSEHRPQNQCITQSIPIEPCKQENKLGYNNEREVECGCHRYVHLFIPTLVAVRTRLIFGTLFNYQVMILNAGSSFLRKESNDTEWLNRRRICSIKGHWLLK